MKTIIALLLSMLLCPLLGVGQDVEGYLVVTLGNDTVGIEHYTIKGNTVTSDCVRRVNTIQTLKATRIINEDASILSNKKLVYNLEGKLFKRDYLVSIEDSIRIEGGLGEKKWEWMTAAKPHFLGEGFLVFGNCAKLIYDFEHNQQDSYIFFTFLGADPMFIKKVESGKYRVNAKTPGTFFIEYDKNFELKKVHSIGEGGGLSWIADKTNADVYNHLSKKWLSDPSIKPISTVAPNVKDSISINDTAIKLAYGSPLKRGRKIFGGLVPYNRRWRTGSNRATQISFNSDLEFNGKQIPKGDYTMFTIPNPDQWVFLLNKQTGQWGTHYDESQEILRIPMKVSNTNPVTESFTIKVEETKEGGEIVFLWDKTKATMPFQIVAHQ